MHKFWLVFRHEYLHQVMTKRFLFGIFSMPLFILLMIAVGEIAIRMQIKNEPIGYLDQSGLFKETALPVVQEDFFRPDIQILAYESENLAQEDIRSGKLQAFYLISNDYLTSGVVQRISMDRPGENADEKMIEFLRSSIISEQPPEIIERILQGGSTTIQSLDGIRSVNEDDFLTFLLPVATGLLFILVISMSGGYLLQAVVEEKENRTIEILITSVSPNQLMAGKAIGNLLAGLTQLLVWLIFGFAALLAIQAIFHFGSAPVIKWGEIGLLIMIMLPAFVMVSAMMTAVGATVTEAREAQQVSGFFILPMVAPYWFISTIMAHPNSPLAVILSLFPLTSPVTLPLRAFFTIVPAWQIILSIGILVLSATGALLLAGKLFRLGMLRYGKRLSLNEIFGGKNKITGEG